MALSYVLCFSVAVVGRSLCLPPRLSLLSFFHTTSNFNLDDLVAQPIAAATAAAALFFPALVTLRTYRP